MEADHGKGSRASNNRPTALADAGLTRTLGQRIGSGALWPMKRSWRLLKWFFKSGLGVLAVGIVLGIYGGHRFSHGLTEGSLLLLGDLQRGLSYLLGSAVVQSVLGVLSLLALYVVLYWSYIWKRRFIVVSEFRVWGVLANEFPAKGVEARLRDELMRLLDEMAAPEWGQPPERARATEASNIQIDSSEPKPSLSVSGGQLLAETNVTLQYQGISLEALNTLVRRVTGRELMITGDLLKGPKGPLLVARTTDDGPWEVLIEKSDSATLEDGLRRLALRVLTTFTQRFLPRETNAFVFLQFKAEELEEYGLIARLAKLGLKAARRRDKGAARENVAAAYNTIGAWLARKGMIPEAIQQIEEAIKWNPSLKVYEENLANLHEGSKIE